MILNEGACNYDNLLCYDLDNIDKIKDKKELIKIIQKHLDNNHRLYLYYIKIFNIANKYFYEKISKHLIIINAIIFIITYACNILNIGFVILSISLILDVILAKKSITVLSNINKTHFNLAIKIIAAFIREYADYNSIEYYELNDVLDASSDYYAGLTR